MPQVIQWLRGVKEWEDAVSRSEYIPITSHASTSRALTTPRTPTTPRQSSSSSSPDTKRKRLNTPQSSSGSPSGGQASSSTVSPSRPTVPHLVPTQANTGGEASSGHKRKLANLFYSSGDAIEDDGGAISDYQKLAFDVAAALSRKDYNQVARQVISYRSIII